MVLKEKTVKFWDNRASQFDKSAGFFEALPIDETKKYLKKNDSVLDFGCATGTLTCTIASCVKLVIGIDISSKMIEAARNKTDKLLITNVEFKYTDIFNKELKAESFNVILAFNIIHFFDDFQPLFHRIRELLKPGGTFIIETSCLGIKSFSNILQRILYTPLIKMGLIPYMQFYTIDQLKDRLIDSDFQIEVVQSLKSNTNFFLVVRKT